MKLRTLILFMLFLGVATTGFAQGAGNALTFDGTNDYVGSFGDVLDMGTNDWTVSAWFKTSGTSVSGGIVGKSSYRSNAGRWSIVFETGWLEVIFQYSTSGVVTHHIGAVNQWSDNKWHNVTAVFNRSGNLDTYIDGAYISSSSIAGGSAVNMNNNDIFLIGRYQNPTGDGPHPSFGIFKGPIDEVRIWNRALTASEIQERLCKRITSSDTYWSDLIAYWRFDASSGTTLSDEKNTYNGTLLPSGSEPSWGWSGAAIGDVSAYDYTGTTPGTFSATLAHSNGDNITATGSSGTVKGIQVYRVDSTPLRTGATIPSGWDIDPSRYWGAFIAGTSTSAFTVSYDYDGHPGIVNATTLTLGSRANLSVAAWSDLAATLNTGDHTLSKTGQTNAEYALGSTADNTLPIELSSFTVTQTSEFFLLLHWITQSETDVAGYYIYRNNTPILASAILVSPLILATNTSSEVTYTYTDAEVSPGMWYYWLQSVDMNGSIAFYGPITINLNDAGDAPIPEIPLFTSLDNVYPNPFSAITNISYGLAKDAQVNIVIYNIKGQLVRSLLSESKASGNYRLQWNGQDDLGHNLPSGVYYVKMTAGKESSSHKAILMK